MISQTMETKRFVCSKISSGKDCERLETALSPLDGVREVRVNPDDHSVCVSHNVDVLNDNAIRSAIQGEGYSIDSEEKVPNPSVAATGILS